MNDESYFKINFIIDEIYAKFSFSKEDFLLHFNIKENEDYFLQDRENLINCNYYFFDIQFSYRTNAFIINKIEFKELLESNIFFVIKTVSEEQRISIKHFDDTERKSFIDSIIFENNPIVQFITNFSNNSFFDFYTKGIDIEYTDSLYDIICIKDNFDNF